MTETPGDGFTVKVPDTPTTALAFRVWRFDRATMRILSLNAPIPNKQLTQMRYIAAAMSDEPEGGWPPGKLLEAKCRLSRDHMKGVPDPTCTCGIYATSALDVINTYLDPTAPVLGVVELGGRVIPATQGYRARFARLAAVLLVDPVLSVPHGQLRTLAQRYQVPALVPHSVNPEDYRDLIAPVQDTGLADEVERFLHGQ